MDTQALIDCLLGPGAFEAAAKAIAAIVEAIRPIVDAIMDVFDGLPDLIKEFERLLKVRKADDRQQWRVDQAYHQQRTRNVMLHAQQVRARQGLPAWQRARDKI